MERSYDQAYDPGQLRYWVWLSMVFQPGSVTVLRYLRRLGSAEAVYDAIQSGTLPGLPEQVQKQMVRHGIGEADSIVYYCKLHGITLLPMDHPDYPEMLLNIDAPPILLTAAGELSLLKCPVALSVVGTRRPSPYTERVTSTILKNLLENDFVIVSGFAKGVDAIAHTTALDCGGKTIAVLGCGINVNYPHEHNALRERMRSSGQGLLISEFLPGIQPYPANFPKRNRILSGLSEATAVMEAAVRSGSLVTAQCACDQGRYLFAVPPADLFDPRYAGVIPLLRDGAIPLMSHRDILDLYYQAHPQDIALPGQGGKPSEHAVYADAPEVLTDETVRMLSQPQNPPKAQKSAPVPEKQPDQRPDQTPAPESASESAPALSEDETGRQIVSYLREHGAAYADDIARALDIDLSAMLSALTELELDGFVESLFGKQYRAV